MTSTDHRDAAERLDYSGDYAAPAADPLSGLSRRQLARVQDYIDTHLDQAVTLEALAARCNLSLFHFSKQFKKSTGLAPYAYVQRRRLKAALQLLTETDLPLVEISLRVGYGSQSSLNKLFQRELNTTPGAVRARRDSGKLLW